MADQNDVRRFALAARVRGRLAGESGLSEKVMFDSLAFLLGGHLAVAVRSDELMVRVGADGADDALTHPHVRQPYMGKHRMKGWIVVAPAGLAGSDALSEWVDRGVAFARSLHATG